jgi:hypothetical protein
MAALPETPADAANNGSSFEHKKWHEIWNPLMLNCPEPTSDGRSAILLFSYFLLCTASSFIGPLLPLLVLLGDPSGEISKNYFYWTVLICIISYCLFLTTVHYFQMVINRSLSFFKITLHIESCRENSGFKEILVLMSSGACAWILMLSWIDSTQKKCLKERESFNFSQYPNTTFNCNSGLGKALYVAEDTPTYPSGNFFLLLFFFLKSLYDCITYNEIFHDFMLPSTAFVQKQFPHVFDFAQKKMPCILRFHPERFEPNIPIRPCGNFWMFTDSQVVLKNVLLACSRVQAYANKHPKTDKKMTISELIEHVKAQELANQEILDNSIAAQLLRCAHWCGRKFCSCFYSFLFPNKNVPVSTKPKFVNPAMLDDSLAWGYAHLSF